VFIHANRGSVVQRRRSNPDTVPSLIPLREVIHRSTSSMHNETETVKNRIKPRTKPVGCDSAPAVSVLKEPEEVADAIAYIASPGASSTMGAALVVDGGYSIR
jgi:NAD(P)-dependent dehydrogenase (short-subunit alcohol dehydrogenase family)